MNKPTLSKVICILFVFCAAMALASPAQVLATLYSFAAPSDDDLDDPDAGLVQASDGNFYGTTWAGGANGYGTVFKITPSGELTTLYSFCSQTNCSDGANPLAGLVQAGDGNFYGTTSSGGEWCLAWGPGGTVFKITPSGALTTLHRFAGSDGCWPYAGLVQASDGNFYGTTFFGGASNDGTVFKITPAGTLTTLHSFDYYGDGGNPYAGLVQASDGNFYGTTSEGGAPNYNGTVFRITPSGWLTTLHSFAGYPTDGSGPHAGLVQASDGNFYGTTYWGGGDCYPNGCGTVFQITPSGWLTTLYSFSRTDGASPQAGLMQASDGNFYGTTKGGGANYRGTVFKITPQWPYPLTTLYSFCSFCSRGNCSDGAYPAAGLLQASDGSFYGTTAGGGANGDGTVFRLVLPRTCIVCPSGE